MKSRNTGVQTYRYTNKNSGLLLRRAEKWGVTGTWVYQGDKVQA